MVSSSGFPAGQPQPAPVQSSGVRRGVDDQGPLDHEGVVLGLASRDLVQADPAEHL
ncbi:MAG TPA: hypothetical protein VNH82_04845 [Candidatus Dormibacteraeota bacterium]|nr:hypothetical protein [Candidatus Dormibacteraeota bacterium]